MKEGFQLCLMASWRNIGGGGVKSLGREVKSFGGVKLPPTPPVDRTLQDQNLGILSDDAKDIFYSVFFTYSNVSNFNDAKITTLAS